MERMKWVVRGGVFILCVSFLLVLGAPAATAGEAPKKITFVSGTVGGPWYNSAAAIAEILMKEIPGLQVTATSGSSLGNVRMVDKGKDAQLAWTYASFVSNARKGIGEFKQPHPNVSVVLPGMQGVIYMIATKKSGIKDWGDLKGKRLLTFRPGGIMEMVARQTLELYGITYEDIKKSGGTVNFIEFAQAVTLMKDGRADATIVPGAADTPVAGVLELQEEMELVIPTVRPEIIQKFCDMNPGFATYQIPAGLYKFLKAPVDYPAGVGVLACNRNLPDDFVYKLAKSVFEHRADMKAINKTYGYISKENLTRGVPKELFHPGAWKYIQEVQAK